jgi:hypothetical protein
MLRPRAGCELQLISHDVTISPDAKIIWATDVFGNTIATARFNAPADTLVVDSVAVVDLTAAAWPIFDIAASAIQYPFRYSDEEWTDLGALTVQQYTDVSRRLRHWATAFIARQGTDTLSLLKDVSSGVSTSILYQSREAEGTQSPTGTLDRG